ncbi:response regulator [Mesorhizobium sp. CAU 1741]|uniref:response regulator n=1 Tax=Mesorhizobium sp. CAU 1741 TaxID=3140366 RepID=UPI00325BD95C
MPHPSFEAEASAREPLPEANGDLALVVSTSPINRIVMGRIAERAGLKVVAETPESAASVFLSRSPGLVILDGGHDDRECECMMESLSARRQASIGKRPVVILLSNRNPLPDPLPGQYIDAVVAKPITPDRLQPLLQSMMDRLQD